MSSDHAELMARVEALVDMRRTDEAVANVETHLAAEPDSPRLNALLAIALARRSDGAIEQAKRAIKLDALDPFAHFAVGFAYLTRSDYEAAREPYEYSLTIQGHPRLDSERTRSCHRGRSSRKQQGVWAAVEFPRSEGACDVLRAIDERHHRRSTSSAPR